MGAFAVGLAEVDGLIDFAVGGRPGSAGNIHDHMIYQHNHTVKDVMRAMA